MPAGCLYMINVLQCVQIVKARGRLQEVGYEGYEGYVGYEGYEGCR
jgi:hypothetical protein